MESLAENNVTLFNEYVYEQLHALTACGKQTLDLLPNLFKGYKGPRIRNFWNTSARRKPNLRREQTFWSRKF
jgi:hypothetical protein